MENEMDMLFETQKQRINELEQENTALKKELKKFKDEEGVHRLLVENIPQKLFFKNRDLAYVSCNSKYARDLNISADQITGKTDHNFYPKEVAEKYRQDDRRVIETGETVDIEESYVRRGEERLVHTIKKAVKDDDDNIVGVLGIFWDITDERKREEDIQQNLKELEIFHDAAVDRELRMEELRNKVSELAERLDIEKD